MDREEVPMDGKKLHDAIRSHEPLLKEGEGPHRALC